MSLLKIVFTAFILSFTFAQAQGIDVHNHLFLDLGVPKWFYRGCFECPLAAKDWSSLRGSKANEETLKKSNLNIVVASIYAVSFGFRDMKESVRAQIAAAREFANRNPDWVIARSAANAEDALKKKKKVLVLSLEGADGIIKNEADIQEFFVKGPISIVTPLHLSDDEFGGAAIMDSFGKFLNLGPFLSSWWAGSTSEGVTANKLGLTERGKWLVEKLIEAKVWVDLAHGSDLAQRSIIEMLKKKKLPLFYSHTVLREYHGAERGLAKWQIEELKSSGGFVGILPSRNYLNGTPHYECDFRAFFYQFRKLSAAIGKNSVGIGSDFNAPLEHLAPGCGGDENIDQEGFWRPDQITSLWNLLNTFQAGVADPKGQVTQFLKLWAKVR